MYFRKYRLRKISFDKNLKSCVSEDPYKDNKENGSRHVAIGMTAPLQNLLNAVKVVPSEQVPFSDTQNSRALSQHIDSR